MYGIFIMLVTSYNFAIFDLLFVEENGIILTYFHLGKESFHESIYDFTVNLKI
jgi:hypothetical protein